MRSCALFGLLVLAAATVSGYSVEPPPFCAEFGQEPKSQAPAQQSQSKPDSKEGAIFKLTLVSDGILCPIENRDCEDRDIRWKNFTLVASDGHTLHVISIPFPTDERSNKHLQTTLKSAEKTLRNAAELDDEGKAVGERALGVFRILEDKEPPSSATYYRLFWTWGKNYWELRGEHLEDVLALESRLKEEGTQAIWKWH